MSPAVAVRDELQKLYDPRYFIETFFWIIDKARKKVPFLFNPPQASYYENRSHNDLILKARKEGFSSLIEAMWLHACLFGENVRAVILSHEMESTSRHFDRVKYYLDTMGYPGVKLSVDLDKESQRQLSFPQTNSSFWIGTAGSRAFGRGDDITHLHLSEVAHYTNQEVLTSVLEACVPGAYRVMETTANGVGEMFHKMWMEAGETQTGSTWKRHFFAWHEDPTNAIQIPAGIRFNLSTFEEKLKRTNNLTNEQVYWYRTKRDNMADKALMPQEYPSTAREAFISSGRHCFNLDKLDLKLHLALQRPPVMIGDLEDNGKEVLFESNPEGRLKIWKAPRQGRMYLIAADTGKGVQDGDWSVASVHDRSSWEVVATWRGRPDPGVFGDVLVNLGTYYNNAVLVPELNESGWATIERIKSANYPHLLNTRDLWTQDEEKQTWDGFPTNAKTRNLALTALRNSVDDDTIVFSDPVFIREMMTFIQNEKTLKFEAQKGCHDDCVMALAIGSFCLKFMTLDETYAENKRVPRFEHLQAMGSGKTEGRRRATGY